MAKAYTPGLKVSSRTTHQAHRILPIAGEVKASLGDVVDADTIVAETFMDGDITPLNVANLIAAQPGDRFTLQVDFHDGKEHLPIVSLKRAA